jgi:hypothetical protein
LKWQEVAVALSVVTALLVAKHLPIVSQLPLARVIGILCFGYAIFLSLRLLKADDAVRADGWSVLRPSLMEKFGALVCGVFSGLIIYAMLFIDRGHTAAEQMAFYYTLAVLFGAGGLGIAFSSLLVRIRWNHNHIEHRSSFGKRTTIPWSQVKGVTSGWHGITIHTADGGKVRFSSYLSGADQLARVAEHTARRNAIMPMAEERDAS